MFCGRQATRQQDSVVNRISSNLSLEIGMDVCSMMALDIVEKHTYQDSVKHAYRWHFALQIVVFCGLLKYCSMQKSMVFGLKRKGISAITNILNFATINMRLAPVAKGLAIAPLFRVLELNDHEDWLTWNSGWNWTTN